MPGPYTVDASVFLNAFNRFEEGHALSHGVLSRLEREALPIVVPTLLLPEVAGAVARGRDDAELARSFALALTRLPHLVLVPCDRILAQQALDIAAVYRLRGSDAVYAAVALRFGSMLITLDREQRERVAAVLPARSPAEVLTELDHEP